MYIWLWFSTLKIILLFVQTWKWTISIFSTVYLVIWRRRVIVLLYYPISTIFESCIVLLKGIVFSFCFEQSDLVEDSECEDKRNNTFDPRVSYPKEEWHAIFFHLYPTLNWGSVLGKITALKCSPCNIHVT